MLDLFGNHIAGFLMTRLILLLPGVVAACPLLPARVQLIVQQNTIRPSAMRLAIEPDTMPAIASSDKPMSLELKNTLHDETRERQREAERMDES